MNKIKHERLLEVLDYNPKTGVFIWKEQTGRRVRVGDTAGSVKKEGYIMTRVEGYRTYAHIFAWFYVHGEWPEQMIDHINGDGLDNRIDNLRQAIYSQNNVNSRMRSNNKSGIKGVHFDKDRNKWSAVVRSYGKVVRKRFDTLEEAAEYVATLRDQMHGVFANYG